MCDKEPRNGTAASEQSETLSSLRARSCPLPAVGLCPSGQEARRVGPEAGGTSGTDMVFVWFAGFTSSSAALCCGIRAMGMESPGRIPASQQKESPLVSGACSIYTMYRGGFCLPRHWKMLHMGGQPHQSLFLPSLVRQGCIKMVFALLDAQNNSFAQGVQRRAVISLLPPWCWSSFKGWFLAPEVTAQAEPGCLLSWVCALVTS